MGTVLTEADSTNEVSLSAGEEFVVRLGSNPSTGYQWEIAEMSVPDIAEFPAAVLRRRRQHRSCGGGRVRSVHV